MLNVQALTQTLSAMPLNQLQQYAQLHRNDPYVVTMALSIANQKKQAMTAQQGQAGQDAEVQAIENRARAIGEMQITHACQRCGGRGGQGVFGHGGLS